MRDIKTIKISTDALQDMKVMHGIDVSKEMQLMVESQCKYNAIIVTKDEYNHYNRTGLIGPNDFVVRNQVIAAKIIGIEEDNGTIRVVDTQGNPLGSCKSMDEFEEKYFIDFL